jgi:hypothetical protein
VKDQATAGSATAIVTASMRIIHPLRPARSIDAPLFERLTPRLKDSKQHFIGAGSARLAVNDDSANGRHGAPGLAPGIRLIS